MSQVVGLLKQSANKHIRDETRYCENCGISFVWTQEEQRQLLTSTSGDSSLKPVAPLYCAGCRVLLPAPPRQRGLVKWYHRRKGYGFICRRGEPDLYVHRSAVGEGVLAVDDLVEFAVGHNEQGPVAAAVRRLNSNEN